LQAWELRSHHYDYFIISRGRVLKPPPIVPRNSAANVNYKRDSGNSNETYITTELLAMVSNWNFVRDRRDNRHFEECEKHHCTVAVKFSSTQFKKPDAPLTGTRADHVHVDRHGLILPYDSFLSLIKDSEFTGGFMEAARKKYEADTGLSLEQTTKAAPERGEEDEEEEESAIGPLSSGRQINKRKVVAAENKGDDDDDDDDDDRSTKKGKGKRRLVILEERRSATPPPSPSPSLDLLAREGPETPPECI